MRKLVYLKNVSTLTINQDHCLGCGLCLEVCPRGVLAKVAGKIEIVDFDACMECGACSRNCIAGAIYVKSGVGCAAAVINSFLGRNGSSCCCVIDSNDNTQHCGVSNNASGSC